LGLNVFPKLQIFFVVCLNYKFSLALVCELQSFDAYIHTLNKALEHDEHNFGTCGVPFEV
jgi:hypothetical protein